MRLWFPIPSERRNQSEVPFGITVSQSKTSWIRNLGFGTVRFNFRLRHGWRWLRSQLRCRSWFVGRSSWLINTDGLRNWRTQWVFVITLKILLTFGVNEWGWVSKNYTLVPGLHLIGSSFSEIQTGPWGLCFIEELLKDVNLAPEIDLFGIYFAGITV